MKRLYRSPDNRMLAGVCSGLGQFFSVDPVFVRLIFAFFMLMKFWLGLLVYVVAAIAIPEGRPSQDGTIEAEVIDDSRRGVMVPQNWLAIILIGLGGALLIYRFSPRIPALTRIIAAVRLYFWPVILVLLGLYLLFRHSNK